MKDFKLYLLSVCLSTEKILDYIPGSLLSLLYLDANLIIDYFRDRVSLLALAVLELAM